VVISKEMARIFWPGISNPVGRTFSMGSGPNDDARFTVIGVVADVREGRLDGSLQPEMYFSMEQQGLSSFGVVARSNLPSAELLKRMQNAVRQVAPGQAVYNVRTMDEVVSKSIAPRRTNTALIAAFGLLALILSAFGVYAVVSYSVAQRWREFGIRSALGARKADIIGLVSSEMGWVVALGLAFGLGGAWALSKVIASMLYGVETHDLSIYAIVPLVLLVPAIVATLVPAVRAMRVSPTEVMRAE
jgi:ABC-type antimicrobial peptide transport system permease subunit